MKEFLRAYCLLVATSLRSAMQYRFSFVATTVGSGLIGLVDFLMLAAVLLRFKAIDGWNVYEVALLYGTSAAALGLFRTLGSQIYEFDAYLVNGELDSLLVRPWDPLFLLLARKFDAGRIGQPMHALIVTVLAAVHLVRSGALSPLAAALIPLCIVNGTLVYAGISIATATVGFWTTRIDDLQTITIYAPSTAAEYPLSILPGWLRGLLHTILPVALTNYLPLLYLLGKGAPWYILPVCLAATGFYLVLVWRFWQYGLRKYNSTGS